MGEFFHICLLEEMLDAFPYKGRKYLEELMRGLPIAGRLDVAGGL